MADSKHTAGPWCWVGNARHQKIYLATVNHGNRYVMGFRRWGMQGAQPEFQPADRGLRPASSLLKFQVGDKAVTGIAEAKASGSVYRLDIEDIDCADARLIAAAPDLLEALKEVNALCSSVIWNPENQPEIVIARAAIAKAEGRS